jgi:hypothetical protein
MSKPKTKRRRVAKRRAVKAPKVETKSPATLAPGRVLLLRTCTAEMHGTNSKSKHFTWPKSGHVACPDWNPRPCCGGGLHGLLWGEGKADLLLWEDSAVWIVFEADADKVVEITEDGGGKCKVPECDVVCCGTRYEATAYLVARAPGRAVHGALITAGDSGTATAGYRGTATAGDSGTATAGDRGTATAGYSGTATAGYSGTATAGYSGIVQVKWWDDKNNRCRIATGYAGEDGIEKGKKYRADETGKLVEVK